MYLLNAFSLSMLENGGVIKVIKLIDIATIPQSSRESLVSAVGHADTAMVFSNILNVPVAVNRMKIFLKPGDYALVGQYIGPRLPEGATKLPDGATIQWYHIEVKDHE